MSKKLRKRAVKALSRDDRGEQPDEHLVEKLESDGTADYVVVDGVLTERPPQTEE